MVLDLGQVIDGKYRIVRSIGEGGMGEVYEGENIRIHRRVAIKVLHQGFTSNADVTQRFEREAQAAGRIGNDHILEVLDLGVLADGSFYMVMEFLDGEPLSNRIARRGRIPPREIAPIVRQLLDGLSAAHNAGIIHRDLKPDNVFILKQKAGHVDFVKIIDFGISKFQPLSGDGMKMTRTGAVMGTPYYMSPEQANGGADADARSDIYAVGVILYEAVTGRVPFDAPTFNQLLFQIVLTEPAPPSAFEPGLDRAFESIILKAMARDLGSRFQSATELLHALQAWERTGIGVPVPPPAQTGNLVAAAGGAVPAPTAVTGPPSAVLHASGSSEDWSASRPVGPAISSPAVNSLASARLGPGSHPGYTPIGAGSSPNIAPLATGGSWATSQPGTLASAGVTTVASKKGSGPLIVAAIVGFAVMSAGVGLVLRMRSANSASPASADPVTAAPPPEPTPTNAPAGPVVAPVDTAAPASNPSAQTEAPPPAGSASAAPSRRAPQRGSSGTRPSREDSKPAKADNTAKPPDPPKPREPHGQGEGDFGY